MPANFWELQRRARAKTTLFLSVFILLTIGVAVGVELILRYYDPEDYHPSFPYLGLSFLLVTFLVAGYNYSSYLRFGGSYVAESLNAYRVDSNTTNPKERQLLNVVHEMSIAAGLPVPPVYILEANQINAFAAGTSPENAAVTVTTGTLALLTRDELQGVVAHEMGHVANGDTKISMRLAAMIMGFFIVFYLGLRLIQVASLSRSGDRRGGNPLLLIALVLLIAGTVTWFVGSILKALVSQQREYLADASSVQYTRNPDGIIGALKKIAATDVQDMPKTGMAYSHLYFDDRSFLTRLFATHPPLEDRIEALQGRKWVRDE